MDGQEETEGIPSIDKTLGAMESEELFRLRDRLREVAAMPGWHELMMLVDVQHRRSDALAVHRGHWSPMGMDGMIRARQMEGFVAGYLKGLDHVAKVIEKVEKTADDVSRRLDQEAEA